jgi:hypothetical protein
MKYVLVLLVLFTGCAKKPPSYEILIDQNLALAEECHDECLPYPPTAILRSKTDTELKACICDIGQARYQGGR